MMTDKRLSQEDLRTKLSDTWPEGRDSVGAFATFTDEEWGGTLEELLCVLDDNTRLDRLLEIRAFESSRELHAVRSHMGSHFSWRIAGEDDGVRPHIDDVHYLDIDATYRSADRRSYKTMSGGTYRLPLEGAERIHLRNYLEYDEDGLASIVDFRVVELLRRGEEPR